MGDPTTLSKPIAACQGRPARPRRPLTVLEPEQEFPSSLAELELSALQVLHSRICRQLESEHLDPAGPQPVTLDRQQELVTELDIREGGGA